MNRLRGDIDIMLDRHIGTFRKGCAGEAPRTARPQIAPRQPPLGREVGLPQLPLTNPHPIAPVQGATVASRPVSVTPFASQIRDLARSAHPSATGAREIFC
jgi:hypothetical protein